MCWSNVWLPKLVVTQRPKFCTKETENCWRLNSNIWQSLYIYTSEVSIGIFVFCCQKETQYARKSLPKRSEATAIGKSKAAYLEIYANLQRSKSYFSITTNEGVEKYLSFRMRDNTLGYIVKGQHTTIITTEDTKEWLTERLHTY